MMPAWTTSELDSIGAAEEIDIAPRRADRTAERFVTIWDVRVGDDVFIRSFHGPDGHWYRAAQATGRGRIRVAGVEHDVTFETAPDADLQAIDAGYRAKYGRSSYVDAMVTRPRRQQRCESSPSTRSNSDRHPGSSAVGRRALVRRLRPCARRVHRQRLVRRGVGTHRSAPHAAQPRHRRQRGLPTERTLRTEED